MRYIANYSGGKDSTAMLHLIAQHNYPIDEVITFVSDWDFPEIEKHTQEVERNLGIKITRLRDKKTFSYYFSEHVKKTGTKKGEIGYGWPRAQVRWCTAQKRQTIKRYLRNNYRGQEITSYIGFAVGEEQRAERMKETGRFNFPLIELNYDEIDCLKYCYRLGYSWGGLYEIFDRVSCFCCPLRGNGELLKMKRHRPELYEKMIEMDKSLTGNQYKYRQDKSLIEIDSTLRGR